MHCKAYQHINGINGHLLTISFVHGAFDCNQTRIDKGCELGGCLPRYMTDLRKTYVLYRNSISNSPSKSLILSQANSAHNPPIIFVLRFSNEANLFPGINKACYSICVRLAK
jgi:hypothetical protein